ncbi:hypothetical protein BBO99_00009302 [Phytophthora kernoviae]|uniref:N-acetylgalactosaminide beta-1,3-galactosyltransferase n=2 Tax=Phytophthora kernoviae TaxID=325452 RepID=A0A3R7HCQ0_9STRA|nr:hypothetical protein G195_007948 [Phytophthora kernoviae 00238/432]RLN73654.1 hypothetical protein BBO99_00009302 [Phytophthora kernoviae]
MRVGLSEFTQYAKPSGAQHQTRVRAVAETWGQRCDKLIFFSNMSDTIVVAAGTPKERRYEVVPLDLIADHAHLWLRTRASLRYIHEHFRHDYDWFYKTDDDTYVIVENLRQYVKRPEIMQAFNRESIQLGHRFNLARRAFNYYVRNETMKTLWYSRWDHLIYNSGGSGYVMNRLFLDKIAEVLDEWTCLPDESSGTMPEDAGVSFCMRWHNVYPWDTRDHLGRERWHAYSPGLIFAPYDDPNSWYVQYHKYVGGIKSGFESAAPDSVAFHYINPPLMYHIERTLYLCRTGDDIPDLAAFNDKFGLAMGDKVMKS